MSTIMSMSKNMIAMNIATGIIMNIIITEA